MKDMYLKINLGCAEQTSFERKDILDDLHFALGIM